MRHRVRCYAKQSEKLKKSVMLEAKLEFLVKIYYIKNIHLVEKEFQFSGKSILKI